MKVSIIIPCRTFDEAAKCAEECLKLEYPDFEVIVLPDTFHNLFAYAYVRIIPTGKILPSHKRDIGVNRATGDVIAFIDADAYPRHDWLSKAVYQLNHSKLAGVCGPGILPPDSTMHEEVTDEILKLLPFNYRVIPKPNRYVNDYPTFNLILWKEDIINVGGFHCDFLTGEDTLLCKRITLDIGKKILYDPDIVVYHYRRPVFKPFLKQIAVYGKHRGYFFKKHPGTSQKLVYALPSIAWGIICLLFFLSLALYLHL